MAGKADVRQLMKSKLAERKNKIDSPFAKYSISGQLQCSLCGTVIKTEALWPVHCKSKTHVENQKQYEQPQKKATKTAAPAPTPKAAPEVPKRDREETELMPPPAKKAKEEEKPAARVVTPSGLPAGFFDSYGDGEQEEEEEQNAEADKQPEVSQPAEAPAPQSSEAPAASSSLPKGFFDDPTMDAQMRGAKTPAKLKEEEIDKMYEKYQESISVELRTAEKIQVEALLKDESVEDLTEDTEIIDREQERKEMEQKMMDLKKKAERIKELKEKLVTAKPKAMDVGEDDLISPDAFFDWRAKSSNTLLNT